MRYKLNLNEPSAKIIAVLGLFVAVIPDRLMDTSYHNNRHRKIRLSGCYYECQYCGSQKVQAFDRYCPVCGKRLNEAEEAGCAK
jgi:hypothetical protein